MDRERPLIVLTGIFTASLIAANLLGSRLADICGVTVSLGLFVFPFTFLTADVITEIYGKATALRVVRSGIALQVYVLLFVYLGRQLPASTHFDTSGAYAQFFSLAPRMVLASIVAYSFSQVLDVKIFAHLKENTRLRSLLLRTNLAAWLSQFVDSAIFMAIFLGGVLPPSVWFKTFLASYATKLIVATFDSPFVKLGVYVFRDRRKRSS